jgi:hypothetical protein
LAPGPPAGLRADIVGRDLHACELLRDAIRPEYMVHPDNDEVRVTASEQFVRR